MINASDYKLIFNAVKENGKIFYSDELVEVNSARGWLDKKCKELQIEISEEAIKPLLESMPQKAE
jgi:DNA polymerase III delta subunit